MSRGIFALIRTEEPAELPAKLPEAIIDPEVSNRVYFNAVVLLRDEDIAPISRYICPYIS